MPHDTVIDAGVSDDMALQLAKLREDYLSRLPAELAALHASAATLTDASFDRQCLEGLHQGLHKLAGSAGIFGQMSLSTQARALELRVHALLKASPEGLWGFAWDQLADEVAALNSAIHRQRDIGMEAMPEVSKPRSLPDGGVWVVDDDPVQGLALAQQLNAFGYTVRRFMSLADAEAEAAAGASCPEVVILDMLFEQEGINATEALWNCPLLRQIGCPLVFVAAHDDFESRMRATRLGAEGYFLKPLDMPRVINRIGQIIERRHPRPERVLIVDDDPVAAEHYRLVMVAAGMEVQVLYEPRAIIETVGAFEPEMVLMDINMPDCSGVDLTGVLRQYQRWATLPIVYLSAVADLDFQIEALRRGGDDFLVKPISGAQLVAVIRARIDRVRQIDVQVSRDSLTGLYRNLVIKQVAETELARARRSGKPLSVVMVDIDHFKSINDSYGHAQGDVVIATLAMLLRQNVRASDSVGRYGGEEFAVVLPECDAQTARRLIDAIRQRFVALSFSSQGQVFACAFSAGVASLAQCSGCTGEELLMAADEALYEAKHAGRNRVLIAHAAAPKN